MLNLLGKKFEARGRGPEVFDCYGLAIEVLRRRGVTLPDIQSETDAAMIHAQIVANQYQGFSQLHEPKPLCLVTFMVCPPYTSHIGVVLEDCKRFIHILQRRQVTIERLDSPDWKRRVTGYYEINQG